MGVSNGEARMARILVIDDDRLLRGTVELILKSEGHEVASAGDGLEGIERFRSGEFDLVACDTFMPNREGLETIREIRDLAAALPIIAFTGGPAYGTAPGSDADALHIAGQLGATETLAKPFRRQELLALVRRCLRSAAGR
jgi:CheY-like chemotaxis protein